MSQYTYIAKIEIDLAEASARVKELTDSVNGFLSPLMPKISFRSAIAILTLTSARPLTPDELEEVRAKQQAVVKENFEKGGIPSATLTPYVLQP